MILYPFIGKKLFALFAYANVLLDLIIENVVIYLQIDVV